MVRTTMRPDIHVAFGVIAFGDLGDVVKLVNFSAKTGGAGALGENPWLPGDRVGRLGGESLVPARGVRFRGRLPPLRREKRGQDGGQAGLRAPLVRSSEEKQWQAN